MDLSIFTTEELLALAKLDIEAEQLDKALHKIKTALKLTPSDPSAMAAGARIYAQLKLFGSAKTLYTQFLKHTPEAVTERFQLGMVTMESGEPDAALSIWQQLLEAVPTHPPALFYSAIASLELNQKEEAQRLLDILIKSAPVDNLYFSRAKEVMQQLGTHPIPPVGKTTEVYQ